MLEGTEQRNHCLREGSTRMAEIRELDVQYVVDSDGERSAVILPIEQYYQLLEDLVDLAVIAERREEPTIAHSELLTELHKRGLLPD